MASLTIIPYVPVPAKAYKELQIKPSILPVDSPSDLTMHEKDGNIMNDDDNLPLERQSSHVSACADQSQNHACSQQCLDKDASVSRGESRDVSSAGEYGIPDRATTSMRKIQTMSNPS